MAMQKWKRNEYKVAALFGGKRRRQMKWTKQGPDTFNEAAEIEVKTRDEIPGWLTNPLLKASRFAGSRKTPIVIWLTMNQEVEDGLAVLYAKDLQKLLDELIAYRKSNLEQPYLTPVILSASTETEKSK